MEITIKEFFLFFMMYSFLGWIAEVIYVYIFHKKLTNRGFLLGPLCPIYGFGALAILILLKPYVSHPLGLFVLAMFICSVIEYFAGFLLEKLFNARWWDYSDTKFNLNGRVCLDTLIPFGIGALIVTYLIHPYVLKYYEQIPSNVLTIIAIVLLVLLILDLIFSFNIVRNFKKTVKQISFSDVTDDVNAYIKDLFTQKSKLYRRLINAFPNLKAKIVEFKEEYIGSNIIPQSKIKKRSNRKNK